MKTIAVLSLAIFASIAHAETDPRLKLLNMYYNGDQPTLSQMLSIRVGRCYNPDAKELVTQGGLFVGKSPAGQNGPLFAETDQVKFWAFSDNDVTEYDNFPAKDYLNGKYSLDRGFEFNEIKAPAYRSQNAWTQAHSPDSGFTYSRDLEGVYNRDTHTFRVYSGTVMRARMNGKYLLTAYGQDYTEYGAKEKCSGFFDRYCSMYKTAKVIKQGFNITEICYFYNRID